MNELAAVFIGGGLGSVSRYGINKWFASLPWLSYPFGTLVSNLASSFILGIFLAVIFAKPTEHTLLRLLIAVGFCGGFSTFSAFSAETFELIKNGFIFNAILNVTSNLAGCLLLTGAGLWIGKIFT